jgi:hypothetical protein
MSSHSIACATACTSPCDGSAAARGSDCIYHTFRSTLHRGQVVGVVWMLLHYPLHVVLILAEVSLCILFEIVGVMMEEISEGGNG